MPNYIFRLEKFKKWRIEKDKLSNETLNLIIEMQEYEQYDGVDYDTMFKAGKIVIKDWCDYIDD